MKLLLVDNAYIFQTPNGKYYTPSIYGNDFFSRYLKIFENVKFVSKVKNINYDEIDNLLPITIDCIEICPIPWYRGSRMLMKKIFPVLRSFVGISSDCDCCILRIAQLESFLTFLLSGCQRKPLAIEMVNDPLEFTDMGTLMRWFTVSITKRILNKADGASYVTREYLQNKYPCRKVKKGKGFSSYYSSITLLNKDIAEHAHTKHEGRLHLMHVSNAITSNVKGHIEVIDIVNIINKSDVDCDVTFVGDGAAVCEFQEYAKRKEIDCKVNFVGRVASHDEIMKLYKEADIFVFPTKLGEGLPRVIIEAMASGLPCVVAPAGGVTELIDPDFIIPATDIEGYATVIINLWKNDELFQLQSGTNINKAKDYTNDVLNERRFCFYQQLRDLANKHID